jgi:hypothetical protein
MRVPFTLERGLQAGHASLLFTTGGRVANNVFDVSADGERFLINIAVDDDRAPITVLLDWMAALDR